MELYDITALPKDPNQNNLYDLTEPTFILTQLAPLSTIVLPEQEMRIDLISYSLYGTVDYADLLLDLNDIDNPLNIKSGDTISYISLSDLDSYRQTVSVVQQQRNILLNSNKSTSVSTDRHQYIENNYQLPPTFLQNPGSSPVVINQGNITITPVQ